MTFINGYNKEKFWAVLDKKMPKNKKGQLVVCCPSGLSRYKGKNGTACIVGAFIPNNKYRAKYEHKSIRQVIKEYPEIFEYMPMSIDNMEKLQRLHDRYMDYVLKPFKQYIIEEMRKMK
jgi:hypothetical protein